MEVRDIQRENEVRAAVRRVIRKSLAAAAVLYTEVGLSDDLMNDIDTQLEDSIVEAAKVINGE